MSISTFHRARFVSLGLCLACCAARAWASDVPPMLAVEVTLAEFSGPANSDWQKNGPADESSVERLQRLEKLGLVSVVARVRMTTLDGGKATLQLGETTPIATGRTQFGGRSPQGGFPPGATSFSMQNLGSMISVSPTRETDGAILVSLQVERTRLLPNPARADENANSEFVPARTRQVSSSSQVRVRDGKSVLVAGAVAHGNEESSELLVLVSAQVVDGGK